MKTSLCMIVKNAEKVIDGCLRSTLEHTFDEVLIVDTGSTDCTKEAIRTVIPSALIFDFTPENHPEAFLLDEEATWPDLKIPGLFTNKPMLADFGAARQFGWSRAIGDYLMWLDSDDVIENAGAIRGVIDTMEQDKVDTALINYDYATDDRGNVTLKLKRERIVRRGFASWKQPIHEVFTPLGAGRFFQQVNIRHRRHECKIVPENMHRNLKVLLSWFRSHPEDDLSTDPRMLFYLGMEERFLWPERAVRHFQLYCKRSGWDEERGLAHHLTGQILENFGKHDEAFVEYSQSIVENLHNPDPFFGTARIAYFRKQWAKCIEWTERGFSVAKEGAPSILMYDPLDRSYRPHIYYNFALNAVGRVSDALDSCNEGLKWNPNDSHLKANKKLYEDRLNTDRPQKAKTVAIVDKFSGLTLKIKENDPPNTAPLDISIPVLAVFAVQLWKRNKMAGNEERAISLLEALPEEIKSHPDVQRARDFSGAITPPKIELSPKSLWKDRKGLKVVIWTGPAWERWSPRSIDLGGIGGSETAAVMMASELTRCGCQVVVLSDITKAEEHGGVTYIPYNEGLKHHEDYECDVFVCSRQVHTFETPWKFTVSFLWVHDIHVGQPNVKLYANLLKVDRILALSNWHRKFLLDTYPFVHSSSVLVTRNGIDTSKFRYLNPASTPLKPGNRLIYSSSPDRGLERLLDLLPEIQKRVPDTELHVYYGFDNWRKSAELANNQEILSHIKAIETRLGETPGVHYHGRVNQTELAEAFAASKVWSYPTSFTETFCISAIEAQAAGCVPVTTDLAALSETVKHGVLLAPPNTSAAYITSFIDNVVWLLTDDARRSAIADFGREWAMSSCGWDKVADEWMTMFALVLSEKEKHPMPRYGGI